MAYDPDFPSNLDLDGLDFDALDLAESAQYRDARAVTSALLDDARDESDTPVSHDVFDALYEGANA